MEGWFYEMTPAGREEDAREVADNRGKGVSFRDVPYIFDERGARARGSGSRQTTERKREEAHEPVCEEGLMPIIPAQLDGAGSCTSS